MSKRSIFITGAAAGIGCATARLFASKGWLVGIYDVDADGVQRLKDELGAVAYGGVLNVVDAEAFERAVADFVQFAGGRLDVMFNNAGILSVGHFEDVPIKRHHALVDVNLKGVINGGIAALPYLKQAPKACLVSMSSASALYGSPDYASYSATKFAVKGFTEALDIEWSRHGIRVMDILPLFVRTAMVTEIEQPKSIGKLGVHLSADDIAATVWRAVHWRGWPRLHWYPGLQTRLMALATWLTPGWLNRVVIKRVAGY